MIELRHLKKAFEEATPLEDVNAVIHKGEVISVIGPSGTGKSTLIRCINMLNIPTSGEVLIDGVNLMAPGVDMNKIREKIGMVFQSYNLYEHLTVIENVMLAQTSVLHRTGREAYDKGMKLLAKVGMDEKALQYPSQLSGGQKQRAAIARTLATDPEIILFDEPTAALDPVSIGDIENLIASLADDNRIMMIVTHSMPFAEKISTRVFYMDQGGIYEDGPPQQIFHNPQKERTKTFIFFQNNLKFNFNAQTFHLESYIGQITKFGEKHMLGLSRIRRLELVFEELFVNEILGARGNTGDIEVIINYNPQEDRITLTSSFKKSSSERKTDEDEVSLKIIEFYTDNPSIRYDGDNVFLSLEM